MRSAAIIVAAVLLIGGAGFIVTELVVAEPVEGSTEANLVRFGYVCIDAPLARPFIQKTGVVSLRQSGPSQGTTYDGRIAAYTLFAIPLIRADLDGVSSTGFESCNIVRPVSE